MDFKRIKRILAKVNVSSILFVLMSIVSTTFAWFAFSNVVDNDMSIDIKAWKIDISENNNMLSNKLEINLNDFYPGGGNDSKTIDITNEGDINSIISYKITYLRILNEEYDVTNQELLFSTIAQDYPFTLNFDLNKTYLKVGDSAEFSYSVYWPLDSGDDNLDAMWGNRAYEFINEEQIKYGQNSSYRMRSCISIVVELVVQQFVDDGTNMIDENNKLGNVRSVDVTNNKLCADGVTGCVSAVVVEKDNLLPAPTVKMFLDPNGIHTIGTYDSTLNIIDSYTLLNIIGTDVINTKLVRPELSDRIVGISYDNQRYDNLFNIMKESNGYIKFSINKFEYLDTDSCYWVKNDLYPNLAVKRMDTSSLMLYYENSGTCKSVLVSDFTK